MKLHDRIILVLPSWYPSAVNRLAGDFIQRHAEATALFEKLHVIHVVKDSAGAITQDVRMERTQKGTLTEEIIYYHIKTTGITILDKFLSDKKYHRVYRQAVTEWLKIHRPALVHVHIAMKAGMLAYWLKKKYGHPYIVSEQWTAYLPDADLRLEHHDTIFSGRIKKIIKNAAAITVVSNQLGEAMKKLFPKIRYTRIQNVVNHKLFFPAQKDQGNVTRFVHASTMMFQKNVEDILEALSIVRSKGYAFILDLFGPVPANIPLLIQELDLTKNVALHGEVLQPALSRAMQQADVFLFYSRFETFGCVIIEANASGIPVIVSDIPVFHELVTENENGFFVKGEDPKCLAEKIIQFVQHQHITNRESIFQSTEKYSYEVIGQQFSEFYDKVITS